MQQKQEQGLGAQLAAAAAALLCACDELPFGLTDVLVVDCPLDSGRHLGQTFGARTVIVMSKEVLRSQQQGQSKEQQQQQQQEHVELHLPAAASELAALPAVLRINQKTGRAMGLIVVGGSPQCGGWPQVWRSARSCSLDFGVAVFVGPNWPAIQAWHAAAQAQSWAACGHCGRKNAGCAGTPRLHIQRSFWGAGAGAAELQLLVTVADTDWRWRSSETWSGVAALEAALQLHGWQPCGSAAWGEQGLLRLVAARPAPLLPLLQECNGLALTPFPCLACPREPAATPVLSV